MVHLKTPEIELRLWSMKFMLQSHQLWAISQNVGSFDQFSTYEEVLTKFNFMCNKREMIHVNTLK